MEDKREGNDANSQNGGNASPEPKGDDALKKLQEEVETLKRQYKGSTDEALRLKEENERLKEAASKPATISEDELQKVIDEKGFSEAFGKLINPLKQQLDDLLNERSNQIYQGFKAAHKGLENAEVEGRFNDELKKLKGVYSINEAMEKAYKLAGGPEAENAKVEEKKEPQGDEKDENEEVVLKNAGGSENKGAPSPELTSEEKISKQISDLEYEAAVLSNSGRSGAAMELLAKADTLRSQQKKKK